MSEPDQTAAGRRTSNCRAWLTIACLGLSAFAFVTASLMPVGVLPDIAAAFGQSEARTGLLVAVYAWVVALLTLPLTMLTSRADRRPLLMAVLSLFILGQALAAGAPTYGWLMLSRIVTATAHAILWGLATPTAVRLAPAGRRAQALAAMAAGVSLATVLGVPLSTLAGQAWGWRASFLAVGSLGLVLTSALFLLLPSMPGDNPRPLQNLTLILGRPALGPIYGALVLTIGGHAAAFTYFTPFMRLAGGWSPQAVVKLFLLFGLSGVAGSFLAGALTCRARLAVIAALIILTLNLALAGPLAALGLGGVLPYCLVWGVALTGLGVLYQSLIFQAAPEATDLAMSIYAIFFNLGIGGGAFIGGLIFENFSVEATTLGGAALIALALLIFSSPRRRPSGGAFEKKK